LKRAKFRINLGGQILILFSFGEFNEFSKVYLLGIYFIPGINPYLKRFRFLENCLGVFLIIPEAR
jgi:hypothetical protein